MEVVFAEVEDVFAEVEDVLAEVEEDELMADRLTF